MGTINKLLIVSVLLLSLSTVQAQPVRLSEEEKSEIAERIIQKVVAFQDNLATIASRENSVEVKDNSVKSTLELFIGKGEPYYYYEYEDESLLVKKYSTGVKMQTSSRSGKKNPPTLMKRYLERMKGMLSYSDIVIESADAVKVGEIYRETDDRYITTATFCQHFVGYNEGGYEIYDDYTLKTVRVYIDKKEIVTPDGKEIIWIAQLGDMIVVETWY